ncbi:hypothetical protein CCR94_19035 [Rhodoblastus sphagnicola]|uniref:CoxB-like protein n=1 Tax=Rhodoblastus sphagnicola TaxID=333368 RepID=A0A2S6MZZ6_9HYPH|nr:transporter [Rhodoblastus sphagnicola]MBB4197904.1 hypothetical protein [Rhodoblastus sphagnicola]PPQ27947.1 hypothetical protein CCR94_19035 [Rhodoblastus sphagnicola]
MNFRRTIATAALCAASLSGGAIEAQAGSELLPGLTTGIALGAPLPQGVFVLQLPSYGYAEKGVNIGAAVPSWVIWSTPWDILGGHLLLDAASPLVNVASHGSVGHFNIGGVANPLLDAQLKWNLGGGWFGGVQAGVYLPVRDDLTALGLARDFASFQGVAAVSYLADGYNLSATLIYGTGQHGSFADQGSWGTNWINIDLTATKKFGKFEVGAVGYGSWDLDQPYAGYAKQSQFALGGLVGYDFGGVNVALKATRTVTETNYYGPETRVWANIVIPVWVAAQPTAVAAKF